MANLLTTIKWLENFPFFLACVENINALSKVLFILILKCHYKFAQFLQDWQQYTCRAEDGEILSILADFPIKINSTLLTYISLIIKYKYLYVSALYCRILKAISK